MLPLGTSAVTIGFGFLLALDRPIDLRGTVALVPLAHALVAIPFVVRVTLPLLRSIKRELREAAAVLGASPARVWREIDLPIVARALAVGAGFAAVVSLGEFGATSFVVRPASMTVPALIFRYLGRPGSSSFATAMALAVVLAVITAHHRAGSSTGFEDRRDGDVLMLSVENVTVRFGEVAALDGASLEVGTGRSGGGAGTVGLGQVDPAPRHRRAGDDRGRPNLLRWQGPRRRARP